MRLSSGGATLVSDISTDLEVGSGACCNTEVGCLSGF